MRSHQISVAGVQASPPLVLDHHQNPFSVTVAVIVTGTATYNVEVCDDPLYPTDEGYTTGATNWMDPTGSGGMTGKTASGLFALGPNPHRAVRINQTAGTGSVVANVIQAGLRGA